VCLRFLKYLKWLLNVEILLRLDKYNYNKAGLSEAGIRKIRSAGRCRVLRGDVSSLPFADGSFALATAFETVYFWPGLGKCFAEVAAGADALTVHTLLIISQMSRSVQE
jgi:hypothetical protein